MVCKRPNIVQAEFFHVGGDETDSLEKLLQEMVERIADGLALARQGGEAHTGIKTVVRFLDDGGEMTNLALQAEKLRDSRGRLLESFGTATGLSRWWLNNQSRRLARKTLRLKDTVRALAASKLREAVRDRRDIAVECSNHSFRRMRREEAYDLVVAAEMAKAAWLFVFQPNDLLADKNSLVASAM